MKFLLPVIIVVFIAAAGYFAANQDTIPLGKSPSPSPTSQELKTFQSKFMKFSIELPNNFFAEEKLGSVIINSPEGKIFIDKNGTNFGNLDDYLSDLSIKNKIELKTQTKLTITGLDAIAGFIDQEKNYYVYADNSVFLLSTTSESLYPDLDQIAQSFRYIP